MSQHQTLDRLGRSGNPIIRSAAFQDKVSASEEKMSLEGAVNKTGIMLFLTVFAATISWNFPGPLISILSTLGIIAAFISGIMTFGFYFFFVDKCRDGYKEGSLGWAKVIFKPFKS